MVTLLLGFTLCVHNAVRVCTANSKEEKRLHRDDEYGVTTRPTDDVGRLIRRKIDVFKKSDRFFGGDWDVRFITF